MSYFYITCDEDGAKVEVMTREQLVDKINEDIDYRTVSDEFLTEEGVANSPNPFSWPEHGVLIIEGEVIVPKAVVKVTRMQI